MSRDVISLILGAAALLVPAVACSIGARSRLPDALRYPLGGAASAAFACSAILLYFAALTELK